MFLKVRRSGYTVRDEEQFCEGKFLLFLENKDDNSACQPIRCLVRHTTLKQFGHWMMGKVRIKNKSFTISGAYGSDGLPKHVPEEIYNLGIPLPQELYDLWNKGGGWNSCGSEANEISKWAKQTFRKELR